MTAVFVVGAHLVMVPVERNEINQGWFAVANEREHRTADDADDADGAGTATAPPAAPVA